MPKKKSRSKKKEVPLTRPAHKRLFQRLKAEEARHMAELAADDPELDDLHEAWCAEQNRLTKIGQHVAEYGPEWEKDLDTGGRANARERRGGRKPRYPKEAIIKAVQTRHEVSPYHSWLTVTNQAAEELMASLKIRTSRKVLVRAVRRYTEKLRWGRDAGRWASR